MNNVPNDAEQILIDTLWSDFDEASDFPSVRPLLAHYTSVDTFDKIIRNNELWLSNPLYMNDWEELQYGLTVGANALRTSKEILDACDNRDNHLELIGIFDELLMSFAEKHALDTFITCFSEHRADDNDGLLSMWRGYGSSGKGVALVFDTGKLQPKEDSPLILAKVHYSSGADRQFWINRALGNLSSVLKEMPKTAENLLFTAHHWLERLKLFSLCTKHHGFHEEREWRLIYLSEKDRDARMKDRISYSITARGVEPKLKLKLDHESGVMNNGLSMVDLIDRIILGPSISSALAASSIKKMLDINNAQQVAEKVTASSIPFRP